MLKADLSCGVDQIVADAYAKSLREHIANVQEAGHKLGVPSSQLEVHDQSKWSLLEFPGYARHFKGGGDPKSFVVAWLHHIHHNPHHWQYWIFPDCYTPEGSSVEKGAVEMPRNYALEMVADWMGTSLSHTNSWDMSNWLLEHIPRIKVHSETAKYLFEVLDGLGYVDVVKRRTFSA